MKGAALTLGTALVVASCGSEAGKTGGAAAGAATVITTTDQGAQAAATTLAGAEGTSALGVKLAAMTGTATSTFSALPSTYVPVTFDCATRLPVLGGSSTPNSITIAKDYFTGVVTAQANACVTGRSATTGALKLASSGGVTTLTLGSGTSPIMVTEYAAAGSPTVVSTAAALATVTYSTAGGTTSLGVTGTIEYWDTVRHTHDRYDLSSVQLAVIQTTTAVNTDTYDVASVVANGAVARTAYASDVDPTVSYTQAGMLSNFSVVRATPAAGSLAPYQYFSINGEFALSTTPPRCIDGDFVIATITAIAIDVNTGLPVAGLVTINSSTVAVFNADGSLSVSVNGGAPGAYTLASLASLCTI